MTERIRVALIAVSISFVAAHPTQAANEAIWKCSAAKLTAVARQAAREFACHAKALRRGQALDESCLARSRAKQAVAFERAESRGACATAGDSRARAVDLAGLVAGVTASLAQSVSDGSRACAWRTLRAAGGAGKALLACHAASTRKGERVDRACLAKAEADSERAFAQARGGCAAAGDAVEIAGFIERHTLAATTALVAVCRNEGAATDEECLCAGDCGDGVLEEPAEECDDGNVANDDGCSDRCRLEDRSAVCAGVPATSGAALDVELIEDGLASPVHLTAPPLDPRRIFVVEQAGMIRMIRDGLLIDPPFLDITHKVEDGGERGLLSMAFHPDYENNRRFFVYYTRADGDIVISRFDALNDDRADDGSEKILLVIDHPTYENHNGGQLAFDEAGLLYAGTGDGGLGGDPFEAAQDDGDMRGKLLRLDVDVEDSPFWRVPPDNPNADAEGPLSLIWAKGLRNPWRFSFDRGTDDLYLGDVGQGDIEEIDYAPAPRTGDDNYGWDVFEGTACFEPEPPATECPDPATGLEFPIHQYGHGQGCSVTGGFVYRGCAIPDLRGTYFYADYCQGFIRTFVVDDGAATNHVDRTEELAARGYIAGSISSFGEDARGEIYIVDLDGRLWKIVASPEISGAE